MDKAEIFPCHEYILDLEIGEVIKDILKKSGAFRNSQIEEDIEKIESRKLY